MPVPGTVSIEYTGAFSSHPAAWTRVLVCAGVWGTTRGGARAATEAAAVLARLWAYMAVVCHGNRFFWDPGKLLVTRGASGFCFSVRF